MYFNYNIEKASIIHIVFSNETRLMQVLQDVIKNKNKTRRREIIYGTAKHF